MSQSFRILIVDDDRDLAANLQDILGGEGYSITLAHDARTAMVICRQKAFDLVISDIKLPDAVGVNLVEQLAEILPEIEAIVITGFASLDTAVKAAGQKCITGYQTKPLKMSDFLFLIRQVVERKRTEVALRESEEKYRVLFNSSLTGTYVTDFNGEVLSTNTNGAVILGFDDPADLVGRSILDIYRDPRERIAFVDKIKNGGTAEFEVEMVKKNGAIITVSMSCTTMDYQGKRAILTSGMDITGRKQVEESLRQRNRDLKFLNDLSRTLAHAKEPNEVLLLALDYALSAMQLSLGGVYLLDDDTDELILRVQKGVSKECVMQLMSVPLKLRIAGGVSEERVLIFESIQEEKGIDDSIRTAAVLENIQSCAYMPLISQDKLAGVIVIGSRDLRVFSTEDVSLLESISSYVEVALTNIRLLENASRLSITDDLTGLYNRRHFYDTLEFEIARALRYDGVLSLVMIDLDGLKAYNDKFGHISGDGVLKAFAQTIKSVLRKSDTAYRYGGDEFAVLLPSTLAESAEKVVQRLHDHWLQIVGSFNSVSETRVLFSSGVAQFPDDCKTLESLVRVADAALYRSKDCGVHTITLASELGLSLDEY
ncbi:MAG: diguanylate cyclase [Chloroflexota bacterium]|nr:diguanylate cyclase [Chloroflexota bacterium]